MDLGRAYAELGLAPGATDAAVKAAFRRLAMENHPDRAGDDPAAASRFAAARKAYEFLREAPRRPAEDAGTGDRGAAGAGSPPGGPSGRDAGRPPGWRRGADTAVELHVPLETLLRGGTASVAGGTRCLDCEGAGWRTLAHPADCPACGGTGRGAATRGIMRVRIDCSACHGSGRVSRVVCEGCGGTGSPGGARGAAVPVAPGLGEGAVVRVAGAGAPGAGGGPPGDLLATVRAAPHPRLRRQGADLATTLTASFADLCLGAVLAAEGLDGEEAEVELSPGTPAGRAVVLDGLGLPRADGRGRGRLLVRVVPAVPRTTTPEQADLLRRWKALEGGAGGA